MLQRKQVRPRVELLEDRTVPHVLVGLAAPNFLIFVDSANPSQELRPAVPITGLAEGEAILAIDFRPSNGELFGVSSAGKVHVISPQTGASVRQYSLGNVLFSGNALSIDFDPQTDEARIVGEGDFDANRGSESSGANGSTLLRSAAALTREMSVARVGGGTQITHPIERGDPGDGIRTLPGGPGENGQPVGSTGATGDRKPTNLGFNPASGSVTPQEPLQDTESVGGLAFSSASGLTPSRLYGIDFENNTLVRLTNVAMGQLTTVGLLGVNVSGDLGFDISRDNVAYAAMSTGTGAAALTRLFTLNLTTGHAAAIGAFPTGCSVIGLSVAPNDLFAVPAMQSQTEQPPPEQPRSQQPHTQQPSTTSTARQSTGTLPTVTREEPEWVVVRHVAPPAAPPPVVRSGDVSAFVSLSIDAGRRGKGPRQARWTFRYTDSGVLRGPLSLVLYRRGRDRRLTSFRTLVASESVASGGTITFALPVGREKDVASWRLLAGG